MLTTECSKRRKPSCRDKGLGGVEEGLVLNTVQICAMARSILLILALPYTLRFSLFEQYWALCLSPGGNAIHWGLRGAQRSHPNEDKHKAPSSTPPRPLSLQDSGTQASQWI